MFVMSSACWFDTQVPPECSVEYAFTLGYWLCTVVCCETLPPYPCHAMPPKYGWLRIAASSIVGAAKDWYWSQFQSSARSLVDRPAFCSAGSRLVLVKYASPAPFQLVDG